MKIKVKLLNYLFPNDECRQFVCNDLFVELNHIIDKSICINSKNISNKVRKINYEIVKNQFLDFLANNLLYLENIIKLYKQKNIDVVINDLIVAYVLYLSEINCRYKNIDIFKDKRSICYEELSLISSIWLN